MIITEHGTFVGSSWEEFCQLCFKLKYESEGYQEMPAWQGDYGIEGFTRTGKVFQCYCPDTDYPPDKLYEEQRDKITKDLNKLIQYEMQLSSYLKSIKIKEWIFVTPEYKKKDLVKHCQDKAIEYRSKSCSILDNSFDVLVHDIGFYTAQIPIVKGYKQRKVDINPKESTSDSDITDWKAQQIPYVENAIRKHGLRFDSNAKSLEIKVNTLTQHSIADFLNGNILIRQWQEYYQEDYERFIRLVSEFEKKVIEKCMFGHLNNNELYNEIQSELKEKLKTTFQILDPLMVDRLSNQVMADWILRCPIDF